MQRDTKFNYTVKISRKYAQMADSMVEGRRVALTVKKHQ